MAAVIRPLSERYPQYPTWAPQFEAALVEIEYGDLEELCRDNGATDQELSLVLDQRRATLDAVMAHTRQPLHSPEHALALLERGKLIPQARKWTTFALGPDRVRLLVPHHDGGMHYLRVVTKKVPTAEHLRSSAPLGRGGTYLIVYGGGPQIMSLPNKAGVTAANDIAALKSGAPLADVLFWHLEAGQPPALYSIGVGIGDRGGKPVEFPDATALRTARKPWAPALEPKEEGAWG